MGTRAVVIVGLRRSGTTILWRTFRQDGGVRCFDEPFHPNLWKGRCTNTKGTWNELAEFWERNTAGIVNEAEPIYPKDELDREVSEAQRQYMQLLAQDHEYVAIDTVRAWNKVVNLLKKNPSVLVVHLVRHPTSWVTSQLVPSGVRTLRRRIGNMYRRSMFFRRRGGYNNWSYEQIINRSIGSGHAIWEDVRQNPEELKNQPAYIKLLAFWWAATKRVEYDLRRLRDVRHLTVSLEEFSRIPDAVMERLYSEAGWSAPGICYDHVRSVRKGWSTNAMHWRCGMKWLGIPEDFCDHNRFTGSDVAKAAAHEK